VDTWETPLEVFAQATFDLVRKQIETILHKHLKKYVQTELFRAAKAELTKFVDEHETEQRKAIQDIFQMERYKIFTVNKTASDANRQIEYQLLQKARRASRARAVAQSKMRSDPKKYPLEMESEDRNRILKKKTAEVKDEELGADPFDQELQVAAYVRGYYLTAAIRFVDNVCLSIYAKFFRGIREKIFMHLENVLDIHSASEGMNVQFSLTFTLANPNLVRRRDLPKADGRR
jgi:glycerol-3-phosphate cytidylyltransferase-like family protein